MMECLESAMHGDRTWWFGIVRSAPGSEPGANPGSPGQGSCWKGVCEALGLAVDGGGDGFEDLDIFGGECGGGGPGIAAVTGLDKLQAGNRGTQGENGAV